ncbi:MAG: ParB/RepB/Spo0J family partition protein [Bacteroidales bacterium]|nr:ParB/RepB/Spo0J family partition protein [Lentimicrobiaceae bacterium]MBQ3594416.1 ParB/RepB/Spo0J family partition protein [Bacteroidales bacterium]MBR3914502.1 ParB/RepB/Spo0J family partition protein [Bacteroidales bacterium]MBR6774092.1 ParB/RepB/Spo0J family partition protein [Bacteroidales bacterium]
MSLQNKKRGLGRGLDAILQSPETDITSSDISGNYVAGAVAELNIDFIEANPFQPRTDFDDNALNELAESIKVQGVIQPVTVRKMGRDKYQLISGERRLRASKLAGLKTIPVYIRVANDEQMLEMALIENTHREGLNAIEVALSYQRLIEECNITQEQLSEKVGKDRSTVTNFLRLLKLPPEVQVAVRDGFISMSQARTIINIEDKTQQLVILKEIIDKDLSVRQVEELVRSLNNKNVKTKKQKDVLPEAVIQKVNSLSKSLNTKIKVSRNSKGKGTLTINFKNDEEFERLISLINKD